MANPRDSKNILEYMKRELYNHKYKYKSSNDKPKSSYSDVRDTQSIPYSTSKTAPNISIISGNNYKLDWLDFIKDLSNSDFSYLNNLKSSKGEENDILNTIIDVATIASKMSMTDIRQLSYEHVLMHNKISDSVTRNNIFETKNQPSHQWGTKGNIRHPISDHIRITFVIDKIIYTNNTNIFGRYATVESSNWTFHTYSAEDNITRLRKNHLIDSKHLMREVFYSPSLCSHDIGQDPTLSRRLMKNRCQTCENNTKKSCIIIKGVLPVISEDIKYECIMSVDSQLQYSNNMSNSDNIKRTYCIKSTLSWSYIDRPVAYGLDYSNNREIPYFKYDIEKNIVLHSNIMANIIYSITKKNTEKCDIYTEMPIFGANAMRSMFGSKTSTNTEYLTIESFANKININSRSNLKTIYNTSTMCNIVQYDRLWWVYPDSYEFIKNTVPPIALRRFSGALIQCKKNLWRLLSKTHNIVMAIALRSIFMWYSTKGSNGNLFTSPYDIIMYERSNMTIDTAKDILRWIRGFEPDPDSLSSIDLNLENEHILTYMNSLDHSYDVLNSPCFYQDSKSIRDYRVDKPFYWTRNSTDLTIKTLCESKLLHNYDWLYKLQGEKEIMLRASLTTIYTRRIAEECSSFLFYKPKIDSEDADFQTSPTIKESPVLKNSDLSPEQSFAVNSIIRAEYSFLIGFPGTGKTRCAEAIRNHMELQPHTSEHSMCKMKNTVCITLTGSMSDELSRRGFTNSVTIDTFIFSILAFAENNVRLSNDNKKSNEEVLVIESLSFDISSEYLLFIDEFSNVSDALLYCLSIAWSKLKRLLTRLCHNRPPPIFKCLCMMDPLQINPIDGDSPCQVILKCGTPQMFDGKNQSPISSLEGQRGVICVLEEPHRFAADSDIYAADMCMIGNNMEDFRSCFDNISADKLKSYLSISGTTDAECTSVDIRFSDELNTVIYSIAPVILRKITPDGKKTNSHILTIYDKDRLIINNSIASLNRQIWDDNKTIDCGWIHDRYPTYVRNDIVMYLENLHHNRFRSSRSFYESIKPQFNGKTYSVHGVVGILYDASSINLEAICKFILDTLASNLKKCETDEFKDTESISALKRKIKMIRGFYSRMRSPNKFDDIEKGKMTTVENIVSNLEKFKWFRLDESFSIAREVAEFICNKSFPNLYEKPEDIITAPYIDSIEILNLTNQLVNNNHAFLNAGLEPVILYDSGIVIAPIFRYNIFDKVIDKKNPNVKNQLSVTDTIFNAITHGWCTTVDKWQGRENDTVWFYIPNEISRNRDTSTEARKNHLNLCTKSRAHVALTRAKFKFIVFGDVDLFQKMCSNDIPVYDYEKSAIYREILNSIED